jgi:hypothetical protein
MSTMSGPEWIEAFALRLGVEPPDEATIETLLGIASTAAHASERLAAPIACYLIGLSGGDLDSARTVAEAVGAD